MKLLPTALLLALAPLALAAPAGAPEDPEEVSIQRLTSIDYRRGQRLPPEIEALDGRYVSIEGYMNIGTEEGRSSFYLVSDACGCGGTPKIHHFVDVTLPEGEVTEYTPEAIDVIGTMEVGEKRENGFVTSIYRLRADAIE